jgi:hypothetical protein
LAVGGVPVESTWRFGVSKLRFHGRKEANKGCRWNGSIEVGQDDDDAALGFWTSNGLELRISWPPSTGLNACMASNKPATNGPRIGGNC